MDPIAHTLFGATMAEAGLKRKTALATATLLIGANIPDIDGLAMLVSSDYGLWFRRGWTHGILALLIWPFLLTGLMIGVDRLIEKRMRRRNRMRQGPPMRPVMLLGIAFLGVWSHPLLDYLNTYGVRLLMPFSDTWFYGDTLFIVDPWFWLLAGAGVVLARSKSWAGISGWIVLGTAVTALITTADIVPLALKVLWLAGLGGIIIVRWSGRHRGATQPIAFTLLALLILYIAFMFTGSKLTASHARAQLNDNGADIKQVMANPLPARTLLRTGIAASETHYYRFKINWLRPDSFELTGEPIPIEVPDHVVEAALNSPDLRGFRNWMRFPAYEVQRLDDGWKVIIRDLRYVQFDQEFAVGIGMAVVELDEELQVRSVR
ncbi:MAG: metal-dependent hydrolase [Balneolaceae bacterium]|nr:MAG: metal-dependent hydrolase [Balneolaceae bacterium]